MQELLFMRIIAKRALVEFYTKEPKSRVALEDWYEKTKKAEWSCFADIKKTFNSVDSVGNQHYVFNIHGNDYRFVVVIYFTPKAVYIKFVGSHSEYGKIKDIKNIWIMTAIKNEMEYRKILSRIDELLPFVNDMTSKDDKNYIELDLLSSLIEDYEDIHYPIQKPPLIEVLKLRMYEMGLTQVKLSSLLGVSPSRVSEYLSGKSEPTLKIGREISSKLDMMQTLS